MSDTFNLELVTPQKLTYAGPVALVEVPGIEGDMGILADHAPCISQLRPGLLEIVESDVSKLRFFASGGVVEVTGDRCTILAKEAMLVEEITAEDVKHRLEEAERAHSKAKDEHTKIAAEADLEVAEAMAAVLHAKVA